MPGKAKQHPPGWVDGRKLSSAYKPGYGPSKAQQGYGVTAREMNLLKPGYVPEMPKGLRFDKQRQYDSSVCQTVIDDAIIGHSLGATCGLLGISRVTMSNWIALFPELEEAISRARVIRQRSWEGELIDMKRRGGDSVRANAVTFGLINMAGEDWKKDKPSDINVTVSLATLISDSMKTVATAADVKQTGQLQALNGVQQLESAADGAPDATPFWEK